MINNEKIGVGIITGFREGLFRKCFNSIPDGIVDHIVVVNDNPNSNWKLSPFVSNQKLINNTVNLGVGRSKNRAFQHLLEQGCDHIFLIEEDIYIKNPDVFEKYITASKTTGIQHFNFSQHGIMNKTFDALSTPNPRTTISYGEVNVSLYPHCVGAFSYYSKRCLDAVGLIDEGYFNACEHVDHTYEIIKAGMHPPFWYFADIDKSWEYLGDEKWSLEKSTISSNPKHKQMMKDADHIFVKKHGHYPGQISLVDFTEVGKILRNIKNNYGK